MVLSIKTIKDDFVDKIYKNAMNEFNDFFELKWERNKPSIIQVPDRKMIDRLYGKKTEQWVIGWARGNLVFVLDRRNFEKESSHKYSKERYIALIKHEIVHLYTAIISKKGFFPKWLDEGISIYLSNQNKFKKKPKEFKEFLDYFDKGGERVYRESGFVIEKLVKKFGKEKLIELLKSLEDIQNKSEFTKKFEEVYNIKLEYRSFNQD